MPSSFLQLSHGDPTLLAQQEGSRWEWPGCLTWAHPYILTTNKSDHETSAGLGWAGRRGGVPKTEALGTALGSNPRPATYWLCGCVTVGRSHGFFKPAAVSSSVTGMRLLIHKVSARRSAKQCLAYGQQTSGHSSHFTDRPLEAQREGGTCHRSHSPGPTQSSYYITVAPTPDCLLSELEVKS